MKKRILVLLLALVMVAGFALPAVAAEGESVSDEPVVTADEAAPAATDEETSAPTEEPTPTETPAPTEEPVPTETPAPVEESAPASAEAEALLAAVSVSDGAGTDTPTTESVTYVDENGVTKTATATVVTSSTSSTDVEWGVYGEKTWYVVKDNVTISGGSVCTRKILGNVNLILCDGAALTLQQNTGTFSLYIEDGEYSLTIYGQSGQTGTLKAVNSVPDCQAIGGAGSLIVNGGVLEVGCDPNSLCFAGGTVTLHNGTIKASCGAGGQVFYFLEGDPTTRLSLPASYYWRTAADGAFTKKTADASYTPDSTDTYVEITTNGVEYMGWNGTTGALEKKVCVNPISVTGSTDTVTLGGNWYVVKDDVTIGGLEISGNANLILCDGAKLTLQQDEALRSFVIKAGHSLTIYGQSAQTGALNCSGMTMWHGYLNTGRMTINGGRVNVDGGVTIEANSSGSGGVLTVNGGSLSVTNSGGDGILIGGNFAPGTMTINGGTVMARSTKNGCKAIVCQASAATGTLNLPSAYYWRTADSGNYKTQASYTAGDLEGVYFELTTTKPANNIEPKVTGAAATVTYGDTPNGSVITATGTEVEGTFAWKDDVTGYGVVGTKSLKATFTPNDSSYAAVDVEVSVTVEPKTIGIDWTDTELTHNGKPQKPTATATGLVTGDECTITVTGEQTEAGRYTATAASLDNPNYQLPENVTCAFTIKAAPTTDSKGKAPQTGDAGVALYVISALGSMSGLAWLGRKKR